MKIASCLAILSATASLAAAFVNPLEPWGESVWIPGSKVNITWNDDKIPPLLSTNPIVDIFLNTGGDQSNVKIATIATGINAGTTSSFLYTVPNVAPPGKIYFLTIVTSATNKGAPGQAWSTRFTITDANGNPGTLAPSGPVGSNSGAIGSVISTSAGPTPTTVGTGSTPASATITSPATANATAAGKPTSGAASFGASGLSAVAAVIVGAAALVAF
ncbi:hypothetical protein BGX26_011167 [Mortierella sp. AD094]|nr:hypothetical protein BGX26_011167 [Mortierella sp. AD094]